MDIFQSVIYMSGGRHVGGLARCSMRVGEPRRVRIFAPATCVMGLSCVLWNIDSMIMKRCFSYLDHIIDMNNPAAGKEKK